MPVSLFSAVIALPRNNTRLLRTFLCCLPDDADIPGVIRVLRLRVPLFIAPVVLCALAAIWQRTVLSVIALCLISLPCLLGILTTLWRISLLRNRRFLPFGRWLLQGVGVVSHRP